MDEIWGAETLMSIDIKQIEIQNGCTWIGVWLMVGFAAEIIQGQEGYFHACR